jgi:hypothetical protein
MKVEFTDSFFDSLKTIKRHNTWWYKTYKTVRYDLPRFFKNIWRFKKELYEFQSWDYSYNLLIFKRSLELTADYIEKKGIEVSSSRCKKVAMMRRAIEIIGKQRTCDYIEEAEAILGPLSYQENIFDDTRTEEESLHDRKVYDLSDKLERQDWKELFKILEGQNYKSYDEKKHGDFEEWFDGSGMKCWWD